MPKPLRGSRNVRRGVMRRQPEANLAVRYAQRENDCGLSIGRIAQSSESSCLCQGTTLAFCNVGIHWFPPSHQRIRSRGADKTEDVVYTSQQT
jgi:hypothetical protein